MSEPLYLFCFYDVLFPEDDYCVEISEGEYNRLVAVGRDFDGSRIPESIAALVEELEQRDEADRRPSEIAAAENAGTISSLRKDA